MLSMQKEEQLLCRARATIENKQFVFPQFSDMCIHMRLPFQFQVLSQRNSLRWLVSNMRI